MVLILERCDWTNILNCCSPFTQQNQCTLANADVKARGGGGGLPYETDGDARRLA